jgi:WD40 repeat protein
MLKYLRAALVAAAVVPVCADGARSATPPAGDPPAAGDRDVRTDRYGDPLPAGALARLGTVRFRHGGTVEAVAFAPDGKFLAAGDREGMVRVWDVASGKEVHAFGGDAPVDSVDSMVFASDGKSLVVHTQTGQFHAARVWDVAGGKPLRTLQLRGRFHDGVRSVVFAPDGKSLAAGGDRDAMVHLWDAASGKQIQAFEGHKFNVYSLDFAPDGKSLATGDRLDTVRLWDVGSGKQIQAFEVRGMHSVVFAPDGKSLAYGTLQGKIHLWDVANGKQLHVFEQKGCVCSPVFAPDGKALVSAAEDGALRLWDVVGGKQLQAFEDKDGVRSVVFAPDGKALVVVGEKGKVRLWDVAGGKQIRAFDGCSAAFAPDGKSLAVAAGAAVRLWDVASGKELHAADGHQHAVGSVVFAPDGKSLTAADAAQTVRRWDVASGNQIQALEGREGRVRSVALAPDGKSLASAGADGNCYSPAPVHPLMFIGANDTVRLWDVASGKQIHEFKQGYSEVHSMVFAPDGKSREMRSRSRRTARPWQRGDIPTTLRCICGTWPAASKSRLLKCKTGCVRWRLHPTARRWPTHRRMGKGCIFGTWSPASKPTRSRKPREQGNARCFRWSSLRTASPWPRQVRTISSVCGTWRAASKSRPSPDIEALCVPWRSHRTESPWSRPARIRPSWFGTAGPIPGRDRRT